MKLGSRPWLPLGLFLLILSAAVPAPAQNPQQQIDRIAEQLSPAIEAAGLKNIAVSDFVDLQGSTQELGRYLAEELATSLVLGKHSFNTIDRANLRQILAEHKLSTTGLLDPESIKKLGKLSGLDGIITGTYTPFTDNLQLIIRVTSIETGRVVGGARSEVVKTQAIQSLLANQIEGTVQVLGGGAPTSITGAKAKSRLTQSNEWLRVTLDFFRKDSKGSIRAMFRVENVSKSMLFVSADTVRLIDDQGQTWRESWRDGLGTSTVSVNPTTLPAGNTLTAIIIIEGESNRAEAKTYHFVGDFYSRSGYETVKMPLVLREIPLGF